MVVHATNGSVKATLASRPALDEEATARMVAELFPQRSLGLVNLGDWSQTSPKKGWVFAGCYPGLRLVAASDFALDYPSQLDQRFVANEGQTCLYATHSSVDWLAVAVWQHAQLVRALSICPDKGIQEDSGQRFRFEVPFWSGLHEVVNEDGHSTKYPLPFHPLDLGEVVLQELFGYQVGNISDGSLIDPRTIPLLEFRPAKPWWRMW